MSYGPWLGVDRMLHVGRAGAFGFDVAESQHLRVPEAVRHRLAATASLTALAVAAGIGDTLASGLLDGLDPTSGDASIQSAGAQPAMVPVGTDATHDYFLDAPADDGAIDRRIGDAFSGDRDTGPDAGTAERPAADGQAYALTAGQRILNAFGAGPDPLSVGPKWGPYIDFIARPGTPTSTGTIDLFVPVAQADDWLVFLNARGTLTSEPSQEAGLGGGVRHIVPDFIFGQDTILGVYGFVDFRNSSNGNSFVQGTVGAELITERFEVRINGYLPGSRTYTVAGTTTSGITLQGTNVVLTGTSRQEQALPGFDVEAGLRFELDPDTTFRVNAGYYRFARGGTRVEGGLARAELQFDDPFGFDGASLSIGGELRNDNYNGTHGNATLRFRMPLGISRNGGDEGAGFGDIDDLMVRPVQRFDNVVAPEVDGPVEDMGPVTDAATGQTLQVFHVAQTAQGTGDCSSVQNACTFTVAQSLAGAGDTFVAVDVAGDIASAFALNAANQRVVGAGDTGTVSVPLTDALQSVLTLGGLGGRPTVASVDFGANADPFVRGIATNGAAGIGGNGFTGIATIDDVRSTNGGLAFQNTGATINVSNSMFDGGAGIGVALTNLTGTFSMTGSTVTSAGGGFRIEGGNGAISHDGAVTQTGAASAIDIRNRTGGTVTFGGPVTANTGTATGINLQNNAGTIAFTGNLDIDTTTGTGIDLNGNTAPVSFGAMTQVDVAGAGTGVDFQGTTGGAVTFADLDIALSGANGTAFDLNGATINANVTATDFDVTSTTAVGTTGVDLSGTSGTGTVQLGDSNVAGQSASIAGVNVGVQFSAASNATFIFGDGESPTDQGSTIAGTTAIANGSAVTNGSYDFDDVIFTGTLDFNAAGGNGLVFVAATATGDGSGSDVNNRANVITADAIITANTTFVLINDGAAIDDVDGFTLHNNQTMASFGNGRTFASSGLIIPANFTGVPGAGAVINDPTGNGAATLTNTGAGDTLTALGAVTTQDFIIENTAGGDGLAGTGAIGITSTGLTIRNITGGQGIDLDNVTGTVTFNDTMVATTAGNGVDLLNTTANFTGGLDVTTADGIGFNATGGGTVGVANAGTERLVATGTGTALNLDGVTVAAGGINFDQATTAGTSTGSGIDINDAMGGAITLASVNIDGTAVTTGLDISGNARTSNVVVSGGTIANGARINGTGAGTVQIDANISENAGYAVQVANRNGASGAITVGGTVTSATGAVSLQNNTGGDVTFNGAITGTGSNNAGAINIDATTGGTATFAGLVDIDVTGAGTGVSIANSNAGGTFDFTGGLDIDSVNGTGFEALSGTISMAATGGDESVTTTAGQAINLNGVTIGAAGVSFDNLSSANSAGRGVNLDTIAGTFTVTGTTSVTGSTTEGVRVINSTAAVNLGTLNVSGTTGTAVLIENNGGGSFTATGGTVTKGGFGEALDINGGAMAVNFGANISHTSNGGDAVSIRGGTTGNITVSGTIANTTGGRAIDINTVTGGTVSFTGATITDTIGIQIANVAAGANVAFSAGTTVTLNSPANTGINLSDNAGAIAFNGAVDINNAGAGGIALVNANANVSFGQVDIEMAAGAANADAISIAGTPGTVTFGVTTITNVGAAANQKGIDFSTATLGGTVSFQSVAISGPDTSTSSIGVDLTGVLGNQIVNLGSQIDPAGGPSSSITDLHRGVVIDNTAAVQFTFGDGESGSDTGSSINVNGQAGAFTVDVGGGTLAASSFDFNDVMFGAGDSANLPGAAGSAVFVSQTGGVIAAGTHGLNVSTGGGLNTITVAAAEALADADQTFVFVAHTAGGTIDVTGGGADGFTLKDGQSLDGFDDGRVIAFGTTQPANVEGNLGATGGTVTQNTVIASNSNGGATSIVATAAGAGNSTIRNTVFDGVGLGAGDAAISVNGAANAVTINNVEITNITPSGTGIALNNNAGGVALTDVDLTAQVAANVGRALSIDATGASTGAITVDAASDIDGTTGTVVSIGAGARNVTFNAAINAANNVDNVIDIASQSGGAIQFGAVTSANATGESVIEVTAHSAGTLTFGNVAITGFGNGGTDTAIELTGPGGSTGSVTFADLDVATANGAGLTASGAGLSVSATSGDFNITGGPAVNLSSVRALNFALTSITANGSGTVADGVVLFNLAANSSFAVTGTTTIDNYTDAGIQITNLGSNNQDIDFAATDINRTAAQATGRGIVIDSIGGTGVDIDFGATRIGLGGTTTTLGVLVSGVGAGATGFGTDFASLTTNQARTGFWVDNVDIAGAAVGVTGTTTIDNAVLDGIRIENSAGNVTFGGTTTISNAVGFDGDGVDLGTSAGGANTGTYTFNGVDITVNGVGAFGFRATDSGTVTVNDPGGTNQITSNNGTAVFINPTVTNITLQNVTSTNSTDSGVEIDLGSAGSTFTVTGTTTITNSTNAGIHVNASDGTISFGNTVIDNTGTAGGGVQIDGAGNRTVSFTGGLDIDTTTGTGFIADGSGGSLTLNVANAGTETINTTTGQVLSLNQVTIGTGVNFDSLQNSGSVAGDAIFLSDVDGGAFNGGAVTSAGTTGGGTRDAIEITGGSTSNMSFASATIDNASGIGIRIVDPAGTVTFTTVDIDGGGFGLFVGETGGFAPTGTVNINGGTFGATATQSNSALLINGGDTTVNIAANVTHSGASGAGANVINRSGGNVTISGSVTTTGTSSGISAGSNTAGTVDFQGNLNLSGANAAISVAANTAGTYTFSGASKVVNRTGATGAAGAAVAVGDNGTSTINFTNGGLAITTTVGRAFRAAGGGTVNVSGLGNTIQTTSGMAIGGYFNAALNATFASVNVSAISGDRAIDLQTVSGSLTVQGGTITNTGNFQAIRIGSAGSNTSGGNATINIATNVNSSGATGLAAEVAELTGGSVTLSGNFTDNNATGGGLLVSGINNGTAATVTFSGTTKQVNTVTNAGVVVTGNTNGTVNFTNGALDIDTTSGTGFSATGGGTVTVQDAGNTVNSTGGTSITISGTTIGAAGVTFQSVTQNGGTNAIVLNNTGAGGFTVTGTGTTDGSGGTIQNVTGNAIQLANASNVDLRNMNLTNVATTQGAGSTVFGGNIANYNAGVKLTNVTNLTLNNLDINGNNNAGQVGISGQSVSGLTITDTTVEAFGNAAGEDNIQFQGLTGTVTITNLINRDTGSDLFAIDNTGDGGTAAGGNLTMTVTGSTFQETLAGVGAGGLRVNTSSAGTTNVSVNTSIFGNGTASGAAGGLQGTGLELDVGRGHVGTLTVEDSTFNGMNVAISGTLDSDGVGAGPQLTVNIRDGADAGTAGNTITGIRSNAINLFTNGTLGPGVGTLRATITDNTIGTLGTAGSGSQLGSGIRVGNEGGSTMTVNINNNTIQEIANFEGVFASNNVMAGTSNITITNNVFREHDFDRPIQVANTIAGGTTCSNISGNSFSGTIDGAPFGAGSRIIRVRQTAGTHNSVQTSGANIQAVNGGTGIVTVTGTINFGSAACTLP